jgi:Leucine-rich repeat (LRR) protein
MPAVKKIDVRGNQVRITLRFRSSSTRIIVFFAPHSHAACNTCTHDGKLNKVPSGLAELVSLVELVLDDNNLRSLPPELFELSNLVVFSCKRNKLQSLVEQGASRSDAQAGAGWPQLKTLNLSENAIQALPSGFFHRMTNIADVSLQKNSLSDIPSLQSCGTCS